MIHELHEQGLSISAISRRTGFDRKTVRHYLREGIETPVYGPRAPRPRLIDPFLDYLKERVSAHPQLSGSRLLREIRALGYPGGRTAVHDYLREIRPPAASGYEHRFETPPGHQAQVDFAHFKVVFRDEPGVVHVVWLFSLVLGFSRYLTGEFVWRQNLESVVRCHLHAFEELGGVPRQILYDRMVSGQSGDGLGIRSRRGWKQGGIPIYCRESNQKTDHNMLPQTPRTLPTLIIRGRLDDRQLVRELQSPIDASR